MINQNCYEKMKGYLIDKVTYFNLHCNKFNANPDEKNTTKFLIENEVTSFIYARDFVLAKEYKRRKDTINSFLESLIGIKGEVLRLIVKNSIITWNRYGLYLTVYPFDMLKTRRKVVISRIKDDNFNPVPLSTIDKKVPVDNLMSTGLAQKTINILKDNGIEFVGWETDLQSLKKIKGISNGAIRKIQDSLVSYGYINSNESEKK